MNVSVNLRISPWNPAGAPMIDKNPGHIVPLTVALWSLFVGAAGSFPAFAQSRTDSEIRGKVSLTVKREPERRHTAMLQRYPAHGTDSRSDTGTTSQPATIPLSERSVVFLEGDFPNRGKYPPPEQNPILDQKDLQFHPQVLPILVGTTVDFPNRDNLFHNVFSYSQPKEFDLGRYPRDDSRSVRFDRPGLVRVYCDIHSHMNATIMVLPHPYFATPNDDGTYAIRHVPEGKYSIVLWVDRNVVELRPVEIRAGETVTADFTH